MTSKRKIIIPIVAAIVTILIGAGIAIGISIYDNQIAYTVSDTLPDGGGKQATVILLGGQSNASGCSRDDYLRANVSPEKYAEYDNGYDNVYINYISGLNSSGGFVKCRTCQGEIEGCFGPELGMADKLNEMYPDRQFFIIKYAWGGTNLFEQWLSPSSIGKTGDFYRHFIAFVCANMEYLKSKNYDVKIEGMCWMQGESDSISPQNATDYKQNLSNLIKDMRRKLRHYAADDGIAFIDAYIADNPIFWFYCEQVNSSKDSVAATSPLNVVVDTISAGLTGNHEPEGTPDIPHYDSLSEIKLGHLFIEALSDFLD